MRKKAPAFQFYPKDWLTDDRVNRLGDAELIAYFRLLCHEWLAVGLPLTDTDRTREVATESRLFQINSLEQQTKSTRIDFDAVIVVVHATQHLERAALEPLVVKPEPRVLEHEQLDPIAALVEEHE